MANHSESSRKEQVLARLQQASGGWVDGPELATEEVGGSEGLRRLRELADEGHNIRKRRHPDPVRDIFQYRLAPREVPPDAGEARQVLDSLAQQAASYQPQPTQRPEQPRPSAWPADHSQTPISTAIERGADGTYKYVPPREAFEQLTTLPDPPQPTGTKFDSLPRRIDYGSVAVCPRCRSKTTRGRPPKPKDESKVLSMKQRRAKERQKDDEGSKLIDATGVLLFRDPYATKAVPCSRCNGYGIVPNVGPIA